MLKNDKWIKRILSALVYPFYEAHVNPSTYDFTWSGRYRYMHQGGEYIETWDKEQVMGMWTEVQEADTLVLEPFKLYLLDTEEVMEIPINVTGLLLLKSSIARAGIEHLHAGLFDPGYGLGNPSTGTLEVINVTPYNLVIKKGQRLVQMAFFPTATPDKDYRFTGRYNGSVNPTA